MEFDWIWANLRVFVPWGEICCCWAGLAELKLCKVDTWCDFAAALLLPEGLFPCKLLLLASCLEFDMYWLLGWAEIV